MLPNRNPSHAIGDFLSQGLAAMQLSVEERQFEQLLAYISLLHKWSKTYNLTAVKDPMELVSLHLLDSLAILPHLVGDRFIDVGSGAGKRRSCELQHRDGGDERGGCGECRAWWIDGARV